MTRTYRHLLLIGTVCAWLSFVLTTGAAAITAAPLAMDTTQVHTNVSGPIVGDTTWTLAASPYVVTGDVTVNAGVTLTIEPGVVVKFQTQGCDLIVNGRLLAQGSGTQLITFTSYKDDAHGGDTNGDGSASMPAPNDWGGVVIAASSSGSMLQHTWIGYGGYGGVPYSYANLHLYTSDVMVQNNTIAYSSHRGLHVGGVSPAHPLELTGNTFVANAEWAVYDDTTGVRTDIMLTGNTSSGSLNNGYGVRGAIAGEVIFSSPDNFPFIIWDSTANLSVDAGATLAFTPGTVIKSQANRHLAVNGRLLAQGTEAEPIVFTSIKDDAHGGDTNGDGSASTPTPNDWAGIGLAASSSGSMLQHTWIGYGGYGGVPYSYANLHLYTSDVMVQHNTIAYSSHQGIHVGGVVPAHPLALTGNTFVANAEWAVYDDATGTLTDITLVGNTSNGSAYNGFGIMGVVSGTVTYDSEASFPFVVPSDLTVAAGSTLTFAPGVVVKFEWWGDELRVEGQLLAQGTETAPIIFTSLRDDAHGGDTNGDGNATTPAPGNWTGIALTSLSSGSMLEHTWIGYGGYGDSPYSYANLHVYTNDATIAKSTIAKSANRGITVSDALPRIESNQIRENQVGIYCINGALPRLRDNVIEANTQYGLQNTSAGVTVDARYNWWGNANGPAHASNPGGTGNAVSDNVTFAPWYSAFEWRTPFSVVFHGTQTVGWGTFGSTAGTAVDVAYRGAGDWQMLGTGLPINGGLDWDTVVVPDGWFDLRARLYDAGAHLLAERVRRVLVLNAPSIAWHAGDISASETWHAGVLHLVGSDVLLGSGVTLTVAPGTVVKAASGAGLIIPSTATLQALGTSEAPIILTSLADDTAGGDTNLDGSATLPRPGDWLGLVLRGSGQAILNAYTQVRYAQVQHSGALAEDTVWSNELLHVISSDVIIPNGVKLTVEPGTIIKFASKRGLTIQSGGQLLAQGTVAQPVTFTSLKDDSAGGDSNGDGDATWPLAGDWRWIYLDGGTASINHAVIAYGGGTASGAWDSTGVLRTNGSASLTLENSVIRQAFFDGVLAWGGPVVVKNTVVTGADRGICAHPNSTVTVLNSTVTGNRVGLLLHGGIFAIQNTLVTHNFAYGILHDYGGDTITVHYSDIWNPEAVNYSGTADRTGQDGNLTVDPQYRDRARENFQLGYLSPVIDAADGAAAPATDAMGAPRYDDPRTENTGLPGAGSVYADMGAFEFVETAASNIDLVVTRINGPATAQAGETVLLEWVVTNLGPQVPAAHASAEPDSAADQAIGPWHDSVRLVLNPDTQPVVIPAGEFEIGAGVALGVGESFAASALVRVPGSVVGDHFWQVTTNSQGEVFEGQHSANNTTISAASFALDLPEVLVGGPALDRQFDNAGDQVWFKLQPVVGQDILAGLTLDESAGIGELYLAQGTMPTRQDYQIRSPLPDGAAVQALIAGATGQTYYGMAYARSVPASGSALHLSAQVLAFSLNAFSPTEAGNLGEVTLQLTGGRLTADATYELVSVGGTARAAAGVMMVDPTRVYATFPMEELATGAYTVRVRSGTTTATAPDTLAVVAGQRGHVEVSVSMPNVLRPYWEGPVALTYHNTGNVDLPAPLMQVRVTNAQIRFTGDWNYTGSELMLLGTSAHGPADVLAPGASNTVQLVVRPTIENGDYQLSVGVFSEEQAGTAINWGALKAGLRPPAVPAAAWDVIYANFTGEVGSTLGQFQDVLRDNARRLGAMGLPTQNAVELVIFELYQAGMAEMTQRYTLGAFGRGVPALWEVRVQRDPWDQIYVQNGAEVYYFRSLPSLAAAPASGSIFPPQAPTTTETWYPAPGNFTELVIEDGIPRWRSPAGMLAVFYADGRWNYMEDRNGNRLTAVYSGGRVARLDHSNGDQVSIEYNAQGRVSRMTGPTGEQTTFTYDAAGEHLLTVSTAQGTITYSYTDGGPAAQHTLAQIDFGDGTHLNFQYDAQGRLTRQYRGGTVAVDDLTISYDSAGGLTFTDATGSATLWADHQGLYHRVVGPEGFTTVNDFDRNRQLIRQQLPLGATAYFGYDAWGNRTLAVDALGAQVSLGYDTGVGLPHRLLAAANPAGRVTQYSYDSAANLLSLTYPDGGRATLAYDTHGRVTQVTNARGQTVAFAYTAKDLLQQKTLPGGVQITYTYDAHRNLLSATGPMGATAFQYDAADRLTKVTYPNGLWLAFTYDAGGRRTRMAEKGGYQMNYAYDAAGRLARLSDQTGQTLVAYTYNAVSQVSRQDFGNGTYTTFAYDANDRLTQANHNSPTGALLAKYHYTYDALGRRRTMTTLEGTWSLGYDLRGQLISAQSPSGRLITYTYDAAGNRVRVDDSGSVTEYQVNALDQVLRAGGDTFSYDADGNLVGRGGAGGGWAYVYDAEGQLTSVTGPDGTFTFEYDALGNRIASIKDGVRTNYAFDPMVYGLVVGEYDATGSLQAYYGYGNGLAARQGPGEAVFYHFDGSGNTALLTSSGGAVSATYSYLPFGQVLSATGTTPNPFQFGGQGGMLTAGTNLVLTPVRWYTPQLGRFGSREPLPAAGVALYLYASNDPLGSIDRDGLEEEDTVKGWWFFLFDRFSDTASLTSYQYGNLVKAMEQAIVSFRDSAYISAARLDDVVGAVRKSAEANKTAAALKGVSKHAAWFKKLSRRLDTIAAGIAWHDAYKTYSKKGWNEQTSHDTLVAVAKTLAIFSPIPCTSTIVDIVDWGSYWVPYALMSAWDWMTIPNYQFSWNGPVVTSHDPNDILGPAGFGDDHWIPAAGTLAYTIRFENDRAATAPAQMVVIRQTLDPNLDLTTFQWLSYGFGNTLMSVPAALNAYTLRLDMRAVNGLYVDINANLDPVMRQLTWEFRSIDPVTGRPPADPLAGFLPPNVTAPEGEGFIAYTVATRGGLPSGTQVNAQADIVFDTNAPILTPLYVNRLDALPPASSQVKPLPAQVSNATFDVTWGGSDDAGGSGIGVYDIYVSVDGGAFSLWQTGARTTSAAFTGVDGVTYSFYAVATDNVGHRQIKTARVEASTTVSAGSERHIYLPLVIRG